MGNDTPNWRKLLTERQQKELEFSRLYAKEYNHGTDGHNAKLLISFMAEMLDRAEVTGVDIPKLFYPQGDDKKD